MNDDLPWKPRSRQEDGRITERKLLRDRGAMVHPMSGAGSIKHDGSDEDTLYEVKDAPGQYILKADELLSLWTQAVRQDKEPVFIVVFENGVRAVIEVERE